jgi:hypothetical protein
MSRTRTKGSLENAFKRVQDFNAPPPTGNGAKTSDTTSTITSKSNGEQKIITDEVIPNFRKLVSEGQVLMNPMSLTYNLRKTDYDTLTFDAGLNPWGKRIISGTLACYWSTPPTFPTWFATRIADAGARTLLRAHAKVAAEEFQGMVTVVEAHKTATSIARPFGQARDLINRILVRRNGLILFKGYTVTKAFVSAWNEYRFGWKPLLLDIQGIHDAYVQSEAFHPKPLRLVARASDSDITWRQLQTNVTAPTHLTKLTMGASYVRSAKVASGVLYQLTDGSLENATARRMGFRLSDVPASVWELVPYSFIVDRFVDVGQWLKAIVPQPGVQVLGTWTTTVDRQINDHKIIEAQIAANGPPLVTMNQPGGRYSEEIHSVSRSKNPAIPSLPTVNYRALSLTQQIDHFALIMQNLAGLKVRT